MSLETATYIHQLNPTNPSGSDKIKDGDDHIRMIKAALKATFPGITGPLDPGITPAYLLSLSGGGVPFGIMVPTTQATAPAGWAICNGQTVAKSDGSGNIVVPDLRGKVIMGLPIGGTIGGTLGSTSKTVSADSGGAHTPAVSLAAAGSHTHTTPSSSTDAAATGADVVASYANVDPTGSGSRVNGVSFTDPTHSHAVPAGTTGAGGDHTHTVSADSVAGHSHSVTVDVTQPSITYHIIIKV